MIWVGGWVGSIEGLCVSRQAAYAPGGRTAQKALRFFPCSTRSTAAHA